MIKAKIFIVEDESIVALDLKCDLEAMGYEISGISSSGEDAIEKISAASPDLVLMDIGLPGNIDGIQASEIIKDKFDIPVVFLTANSDTITIQRAKLTDPFGYVLKPFDQRELFTVIEMALYKFKTESRLKASQRWLSTTLKSIGDAVIATNVNGLVTFMNTVAESLTGFSYSEADGKPLEEIFNIINEFTREKIEHPVAKVIRNGAVVGLANHTLLISKNGKEIPIDDSASPIRDDKNNIIGVVLVFRDITERKLNEQKIIQFAENAKNLIELSPYAIIVHRDNKVLFCNETAVKIFGAKDKNDLIGKPPLDLVSAESKELVVERFKYMNKTGRSAPLTEVRLLRVDGSVVDVEISAGVFLFEGEPAIQAIARDISDRKQDLQTIRQSEEKYRITFENTGTSTQIVEADGTISLVNGEFENLSGYSKDEILGKKPFTEFIAPGDKERLLDYHNLRRKNPGAAPGSYEFKFVDRWGNIRNIINTVALIPGTDKSIVSLLDITERKRVEEALKTNQRKIQAIINAIPDLLFMINKDNYFVGVQSSDDSKLLLPPDMLIGRRVDEILPPEVARLTIEKSKVALETREHQVYEYDFPFKGQIMHEEARIVPTGENEVLVMVRDITDSVIAKENLRKSETLFRLVWENSADGLRLTDENGTVLMVNESFCKMFDVSKDYIVGKSFAEIFKKEIRLGILSRHLARFRTKTIRKKFQQEIILWNGKKVWVEVLNSMLELDGSKPVLVSIFHDITERKIAEQRLTGLNECFLGFGANGNENIDSIVSFVGNELNADYATYTKLENGKLTLLSKWNTPKDFREIDDPEGHVFFDFINGRLSGFNTLRNLEETDYFVTDPNIRDFGIKTILGIPIHVEGFSSGVLCVSYKEDLVPSEDDLSLLGIGASAINVEENRLLAEAEMRLAKEAAERADRLKTDFLAQMSHEIRTPINTILSFTSLLKEELEGKIKDELSSSFKIIDSGGRRLTRTIDMILTMSQLQSGNYELSIRTLDIFEDILESLFREFSNTASAKGLGFELFKKSEKVEVFGDVYTLTQLFQNLIDNALKYTKSGKVDITVFENEQNQLCVEVRDTGIGISKDYLPFIFSSFSQEETGYTRRFEGNGLGLALVKKYSELNNTEILVESEKGKGTVFTVVFKDSVKK
ncbi:MAG: PAS domain S-box protein [Bacteroidota bacterium]|nr:PAS domain S-box protein [Bacteroidota bacterium]